MLTYATLQDRPREFLAATGLTHAEFARLLPAFAVLYPPDKTWEGKVRQRQGGGAQDGLPQMEDTLLFILVYQKTHPLQTMHGLPFNLSQPQTNDWIQHLLPVVQHALADLDVAPERDASRVATSHLTLESAPHLAIDGTERRRHANVPRMPSRKKSMTAARRKRIRIKICCSSTKTRAQSPIWGRPSPAKRTTKKAADAAQIAYPPNATLDKDTGFPGYEPEGVLTAPPKKSRKAGT